jgi:hydrogenase maturation factor
MRVVELLPDGDVALCEDDIDRRAEVLIGILDDVVPGEFVLVHAGTALARLAGPTTTISPRPAPGEPEGTP